jgi:hypothetical protein
VTISLSPLTAAADHSNTRTPYPTQARSTAGEYDGFEYAGLPVKYRIYSIMLFNRHFHDTSSCRYFSRCAPTHSLSGFRVGGCMCTSVAVDSSDESITAAKDAKLTWLHRRGELCHSPAGGFARLVVLERAPANVCRIPNFRKVS